MRVRRGWFLGSLRTENRAVRTRRRLAGLLVDVLGALVLNPAAQALVDPHVVLVIVVTSLEPTLLNVSVIDFRTRKALECSSS